MPANREVQTIEAFMESAIATVRHYEALGNSEAHGLGDLIEGFESNGLIVRGGSETYDQDLEAATKNATSRPFGLEVNTLSPSLKLVLYPRMIFKPTEEDIDDAKKEGFDFKTEGPQTMVYVLDEFLNEIGQVENTTANLLFIGHMTGALLKDKYPLETEERSLEFLEQVREGLDETRRYIGMLDIATRAKLTPRIAKLGIMTDEELAQEAKNFVLYEVEPLKMPGLIEPKDEKREETPQEAVQNGNSYLHLNERNLPLIPLTAEAKYVPQAPWVEYGRNRWNRSHQLFGRYEAEEAGLRVDFKLDSTHFPGKYHFFDTIEVTQESGDQRQQIIFGQELDSARQAEEEAKALADPNYLNQLFHKANFVVPVVLAGDFDFSKEPARKHLEQLANDKGTKQDVAVVLKDILTLAAQGQLRTLEGYLGRN